MLRWPAWWWIWFQVSGLSKANLLSLQNDTFRSSNQFWKLPQVPIVLAHEHGREEWDRYIIFQKQSFNHATVLSVRFASIVGNTIKKVFSITFCNGNEQYQQDFFSPISEKVPWPIFLTQKEFNEIGHFLNAYLKVQRWFYQTQVDNLLSIYPSILPPP